MPDGFLANFILFLVFHTFALISQNPAAATGKLGGSGPSDLVIYKETREIFPNKLYPLLL